MGFKADKANTEESQKNFRDDKRLRKSKSRKSLKVISRCDQTAKKYIEYSGASLIE